jgi:hypothetical protein
MSQFETPLPLERTIPSSIDGPIILGIVPFFHWRLSRSVRSVAGKTTWGSAEQLRFVELSNRGRFGKASLHLHQTVIESRHLLGRMVV